jgi:hypothetical protein
MAFTEMVARILFPSMEQILTAGWRVMVRAKEMVRVKESDPIMVKREEYWESGSD